MAPLNLVKMHLPMSYWSSGIGAEDRWQFIHRNIEKNTFENTFQYQSLRLAEALCTAFLQKEKCFWSAPINEGSDGTSLVPRLALAWERGYDGTYRVAAAFTQFAGGSTKYFGTYHAEFPKPKRDPA